MLINQKISKQKRDIRLIQFGEGNFLRGFADVMIDMANQQGVTDIGVAVVKPIAYGDLTQLHKQQGIYSVLLRGKVDGQLSQHHHGVTCIQQVIDCADQYESYAELAKLESLRFVLSNTTEAGIVYDDGDQFDLCPPRSFPGKLTKFLYDRYVHFNGEQDCGLILFPVELIEDNGTKLRECVLQLCRQWGLPDAFIQWVEHANQFCNTLVDRIVTGYPTDEAEQLWHELGYEDRLLVTGEPFGLWVIESDQPEQIAGEFPLHLAGQPVIFTKDQQPYRNRKVRILNGAHTGMVAAAYLAGKNTVLECMQDTLIQQYMHQMVYDEIAPTVDLAPQQVKEFADAVLQRFGNPFIQHALLSIALNSVSKWRVRILPTLLDSYEKNNRLPRLLTFSFAALLAFYAGDRLTDDGLVGTREDQAYTIQDDREVLLFFAEHAQKPPKEYVKSAVRNTALWGRDLSSIAGFEQTVRCHLDAIQEKGMKQTLQELLK